MLETGKSGVSVPQISTVELLNGPPKQLIANSWATIENCILDDQVPPSIKLRAAQWVLDAAGEGAGRFKMNVRPARKELHEMTLAELEDHVAALQNNMKLAEASPAAGGLEAADILAGL